MSFGYIILKKEFSGMGDSLSYVISKGKSEAWYEADEECMVIQGITKEVYIEVSARGISGSIPVRNKSFHHKDLNDSLVFSDSRLGEEHIIVSNSYASILSHLPTLNILDFYICKDVIGLYSDTVHDSISSDTLFQISSEIADYMVQKDIHIDHWCNGLTMVDGEIVLIKSDGHFIRVVK